VPLDRKTTAAADALYLSSAGPSRLPVSAITGPCSLIRLPTIGTWFYHRPSGWWLFLKRPKPRGPVCRGKTELFMKKLASIIFATLLICRFIGGGRICFFR
jgi:hypothetical protein